MTTYQTRFKFTQASLKSLPANGSNARSTDKEYSDKEISNLKLLVGKSGQKRYLVRYSIKQALKYPNQYAGSFIALLMHTGVRKMELLTAKWQDLDKAKRKLHVPMTKNGKSREVYLTDNIMKIICALPKQSNNPYIFLSMITGKHIAEPR